MNIGTEQKAPRKREIEGERERVTERGGGNVTKVKKATRSVI